MGEDEVDNEALPSSPNEKTKREGWIYAFHDKDGYPRDTERSGKWLVFAPATNIDTTWTQFKKALHQGSFGRVMKVATRARLDRYDNVMKHVICVYTYDYEDIQDIKRVRQALRSLGVTWKISYKDDETTNSFQYASNSPKPVSRHRE